MSPDAADGGGTVRQWMTRPPIGVAEGAPIRSALARMQSEDVRHLLVMDGGILTGIVSSRDVSRLLTRDWDSPLLSEPVRRIMSEDPTSVAPDTRMITAARLLLERRIGALPVRDDERIVGIFTVADALDALLAMVEGGRR